MTTPRILSLLLALALLTGACAADNPADTAVGSDEAEAVTEDATADEMADDEMAMDDEMADDEMAMDDMDGMAMGDPDATPADEVGGADLESGEFVLLDSAPEGYESASGTAFLARTDDGATATLYVEGMPADTQFVSHIHEQSCDDENGGPHFKFDPDGSDVPPNEIHLGFTSDADGNGTMTATSDMVPGEDARSLVIHPADFPDNRALCADFS